MLSRNRLSRYWDSSPRLRSAAMWLCVALLVSSCSYIRSCSQQSEFDIDKARYGHLCDGRGGFKRLKIGRDVNSVVCKNRTAILVE